MIKNKYLISEFISTTIAFLLTKIFYPKARLIRRPLYIRGKKGMIYGEGFTTGHGCRIDLTGKTITLRIGKNCLIGDYSHIVAHQNVVIRDNWLMAAKVFISDTTHGCYNQKLDLETPPNDRLLETKPVKIGKNVWIGENVCILSGVTIGDGVVIGANAVVTDDIESYSIVGGVPAKLIKKF